MKDIIDHTLYHFVKGIIPKIINNNLILHYDASKKNDIPLNRLALECW